jgi:hypothetical protein
MTAKYYVQTNPTSNPFGAVGSLLGFSQVLSAGSQVGSLSNNIIMSPTVTWEQHIGFTRLRAYAATGQDFTSTAEGMTLLNGTTQFPQLYITGSVAGTGTGSLEFGPSTSFGNAGMYQNQLEYESSVNMVKGRNTIRFGGQLDQTQLNVINNNTNTDNFEFSTFTNFVKGTMKSPSEGFEGAGSRYYRSNTAGIYANDNFKLRSNLTLTGGLRWDFDGPLSEKYGRLTGFNPNLYSFNLATDTITSSGLEVASNNPTFGTAGAGNSLMTQRQWGFAPRVGVAWAVTPKLTLRAGYGMYYDRGELFSYFSPPAGAGFNGPFGVTLSPPFVLPVSATLSTANALSSPFAGITPAALPGSAAAVTAYLPNLTQTETGSSTNGKLPAGNLFGPLLFGGYNINNKLPYTENWTFDLQYQLSGDWLFDIGYVGNHGQHEVIPIPFDQPLIATASNSVNGFTSSYGGVNIGSCCVSEPISTSEFSGNAPVRVPYVGYDMNSVTYNAEGISNYDALQVQVHKRFSHGLQLTAAYTYSHALDEQSGAGLFVTGNNPAIPQTNYASADFDQTHVFLVNYTYTLPSLATTNKGVGYAINGWILSGVTVAQSGQPYSVYDYSGSIGSLYYGTDIELSNPIVPLVPGIKASQAKLQGTNPVNPAYPVLNENDFAPQFVAPGTNGVPACDPSGACDVYESLFGTTGRNMYRGPFQVRFDMSLAKQFPLMKNRLNLRFEFDAFNVFNHPDFDAPNNDVSFFSDFEPPPISPPGGSLGYIQHTVGSSRFLQLQMRLQF